MNKVFIIAEAGVNHNGDLNLAKELIDAACNAGADAVKFQTFNTADLVTRSAKKAKYQIQNTGEGNQFEMLKKLELTYDDHLQLIDHCNKNNIMFLSTPFDFESAIILNQLNVPMFKISSGDLNNLPFLRYVAKFHKPIILSTGMSNLEEVQEAVDTIYTMGNKELTLLHCTSNYPTKYEDVNLRAMSVLKEKFKIPIGYSDHSIGIEVSLAAVAMGAEVIEKHFTLDKCMVGPDHKASLNPTELKELVSKIRNVEVAMGEKIKKCSYNEENTKISLRKSIVASKNINKGEKITYEHITLKRPGNGINPKYFDDIVGKVALKDIKSDIAIQWSYLEG